MITKRKVEENDDVKDLVNKNSRIEYTAIAEGSLRTIQKGASIQLERRGYFFVDQAALGDSRQIRLNFIPDGKAKSMSVITHQLDQKEVAGGKGKADGANRADQKKLAAASGSATLATDATDESVAVPVSKKEAKKAAKKEQKKATKATGKPGDAEVAEVKTEEKAE